MCIPLAPEVYALCCNSKTPLLGNCGAESKCEGRTMATCTTTYGTYYEPQTGIACIDAGNDKYCAQTTGSFGIVKCTCEFSCTWDATQNKCKKGSAHMGGVNQICSTQQEYQSQSCSLCGG